MTVLQQLTAEKRARATFIRAVQARYPEPYARVRAACATGARGFDLDMHAACITADAEQQLDRSARGPMRDLMRALNTTGGTK